jgi:hypothetical protein
MVNTTPKQRKQRTFTPVVGTFLWKTPWNGDCGDCVISTKTGATVYHIAAVRSNPSAYFGGPIVGFEIVNLASGEVYSVSLNCWGMDCDCWDGLLRQQYAQHPSCRSCEHCKAVETLLPAVAA